MNPLTNNSIYNIIQSKSSNNQQQNVHQYNHQQILNAIKCLICPDENLRSQSQNYLRIQQNTHMLQLVKCLLFLSINCDFVYDRQLCMLYLRNVIQNEKECMGNIILQIEKLLLYSPTKQLRQLGLSCMVVYLNKLKHARYKKSYIDSLISKLNDNFQKNTINIQLIGLITHILGDSSQTKKSGLYFSNNNQKVIHNIITKYSFAWPNKQNSICGQQKSQCLESSPTWVSFILALCNYTGFVPPCEFIYRNIISTKLKFRQIITITEIFNKIYYRFTVQQYIFNMLNAQIQRLNSKQFIKQLQQQEYAFTMYIKSMQNAIISLFGFGMICLHWKDNNPCSCFICIQVCSEMFFINLIGGLLMNIEIGDFQSEGQQICSLLSTLIKKYHTIGFSFDKLSSFALFLCEKLSQNNQAGFKCIYWLMSNITPQTMKYFDYKGAIICGLYKPNLLIQQSQSKYYFFQMVKHFLKQHPQINQKQQPCSSITLFLTNFYSNNTYYQHANLSIKSYLFSILCNFLIRFRKQGMKTEIQQALKIGYELLEKYLSQYQKNNNNDLQNILEVILEGLRQLSQNFSEYLLYFHQTMIKQITQQINSNCLTTINISINLLKIIQSYLEYQHINPQFLQIIKFYFLSKNQAWSFQCCQLLLKALLKINLKYSDQPTSSQQIKNMIKCIIQTGILQHIMKCYLQEDDQPLYSQILMEIIIHEQFYHIVQEMLSKVVNGISTCLSFSYYFDFVFQAIIILYDFKCDYTQQKGIYKRVQEMRLGNIQQVFQSLTIQQGEDGINDNNKKRNKQMKWSQLSGVRNTFAKESIASTFISSKISLDKI